MKKTKILKFEKALELMNGGSTMMLMHDNDPESPGQSYFIMPHGKVTQETAERLLMLPQVQPGGDGLFPGISQTFKVRR